MIERTTVHVSDDSGRIAMLEKRTVGNAGDDHNTAEELTRYVYSNHLQSASLELDESGAIISYEEYHPYGTTSYQAMNASIHAVAKRYRYTGKERDEESGLYYHGARYYIPWLCRWTAVDPLESKYAGMSPYNYGFNNPILKIDEDGMSDGVPKQYEIQKSDTFEKLANQSEGEFSVDDLKKWNHGIDPTKLQIGQRINISDPEEPLFIGSRGKALTGEQGQWGGSFFDRKRSIKMGKYITPIDKEKFINERGMTNKQLEAELLDALTDGVFGSELEAEIEKVVENFSRKVGADYINVPFAKEMRKTKQYKDLENYIQNEFNKKMVEHKGDYSKVKLENIPIPNFTSVTIPSLYTLVGGTQQVDVYLSNIRFVDNHYRAEIIFDIIDTFGVDEDDAVNKGDLSTFLAGEGLRSFWVLQHERGYQPFKHIFRYKINFRGKY